MQDQSAYRVFDNADCVTIDVRAGSGGDDSRLFSVDLAKAYEAYAKNSGMRVEWIGENSLMVTGSGAGDLFRDEPGNHCVQRIPPTESKGRRQTSFVMVAVLPYREASTVSLSERDVSVETMRGSGPGGQHRNKTDSCVRMTHNETRLQVTIDGRDQRQNRIKAFRILAAKLEQMQEESSSKEHASNRRNQMGNGNRGDKVRTYNFIKSRAVDHRTGSKTTRVVDVIGKGRFDLLR